MLGVQQNREYVPTVYEPASVQEQRAITARLEHEAREEQIYTDDDDAW